MGEIFNSLSQVQSINSTSTGHSLEVVPLSILQHRLMNMGIFGLLFAQTYCSWTFGILFVRQSSSTESSRWNTLDVQEDISTSLTLAHWNDA